MENSGGKGSMSNVCGKTGIGKDKGVKEFWIACTYEDYEVYPNCNCCGPKGNNVFS